MQHDDSPSIQEETFYNTQRGHDVKRKISKGLKGNLFGQDPPIVDESDCNSFVPTKSDNSKCTKGKLTYHDGVSFTPGNLENGRCMGNENQNPNVGFQLTSKHISG